MTVIPREGAQRPTEGIRSPPHVSGLTPHVYSTSHPRTAICPSPTANESVTTRPMARNWSVGW